MKAEERKFNYSCDITYTNNSVSISFISILLLGLIFFNLSSPTNTFCIPQELGFDYLRDNLTSNREQLVMRW